MYYCYQFYSRRPYTDISWITQARKNIKLLGLLITNVSWAESKTIFWWFLKSQLLQKKKKGKSQFFHNGQLVQPLSQKHFPPGASWATPGIPPCPHATRNPHFYFAFDLQKGVLSESEEPIVSGDKRSNQLHSTLHSQVSRVAISLNQHLYLQ